VERQKMIEPEKARALAGQHPVPTGMETVPLESAFGRVLAEDVYADREVPPFPRATMDGYACRREDLPGPLEVLETIPAGKVPTRAVGRGQCSKIMTGAMVPEGADCVIMKEYVKSRHNGLIHFTAGKTDTHIDARGQDVKKGDLLLQKGTRLTSGQIGIIASTGKIQVNVSQLLNIGILATGSELVEPGQRPEGAQIRNSNGHQLAAQVRNAGHRATYLGIVEDHRETLSDAIQNAMAQVDLLLLTGGASAGELDLVPGVLQELGFQLEFDQVAMQPGKPVCFGHMDGQACFGLSGNPVSSFVQFELLVRPYLNACSGETPVNRRIRIRLEKGYRRNRADRQFFLPVSFTEMGTCEPVAYHGSGHLYALEKAMGFAEIPAGQTTIRKGEFVHVRLI
jgi:molybdopterin molybdotransferase